MIAPVDDFPGQLERDVAQAFGPGGLLARSRDFEYRPQQQTMAAAVARACQKPHPSSSLRPAPGVGKSLAYLVPAVLHAQAENRKALVSTHTINLQEQLFYKDIPLVQKLLPHPFQAVLLKGRQNYLCPLRLERAMTHGTELFASREQDELKRPLGMEPGHARTAPFPTSTPRPTRRSGSRSAARPTSAPRAPAASTTAAFYQNAQPRGRGGAHRRAQPLALL